MAIRREEAIAATTCDRSAGLARGSQNGALGAAKIVLVEEDQIALSHVREIIEQNFDFDVVAACRCADGAMAAVQLHRPALVILDVRLLGRDGVALIRDIIAVSEAKVVVFTAALPKEEIVRVLRSGAEAIVFKDQPSSALVSCVRQLFTPREGLTPKTSDCLSDLTPREREIVKCAAEGARNKEIARQLGISEGTVKSHLFRAYYKLSVRNRIGLISLWSARWSHWCKLSLSDQS